MPTLTILYHSSLVRVGDRARLPGILAGETIQLSRLEPQFVKHGEERGAPLLDPFVSRRPILLSAAGNVGIRLAASGGGMDVLVDGAHLEGETIIPWTRVGHGVVLELSQQVVLLLHSMDVARAPVAQLGLVGNSENLESLRADLLRVADLSVPVLIRGETGSGKELLARAILHVGPRSRKPFISVNMAAVPPSTAAAELFGHTRGAYTGAAQEHRGHFGRAHGGTLFLDEIGDTPLDVQTMMMRVLETGEIQPVGGQKVEKVDVRLLTATDAPLERLIAEGRFREPLFHRIGGYQLRIPPLRERRDDLGLLLVHFLREELETVGEGHRLSPVKDGEKPWLPAPLVGRLVRFSWPGNVRQLRNAVRQLVISSRGETQARLDTELDRLLAQGDRGSDAGLPPVAGLRDGSEAGASAGSQPRRKPSEITEDELLAALRGNRWRTAITAQSLGISRTSLYALIARSKKLRKARDVPSEELLACHKEYGGDVSLMAERLEVSDRGIKLRLKELGIED
ncbi:MAG: sigma-54-dependent Fis family transcriptional regulator [Deltaproteobacteria bacterium]|nr:sigma-54-dependent Fis family transcriptional regulator [Deltaproteobacteria bacterium]